MGKKADWESLPKKFLSFEKEKGHKKLLSNWSTSGVDKIPMQDEYDNDQESDMDLDKKIIKWGESINATSFVGRVAFWVVRNAKSADFLEESCKIIWERLVSKYGPHTALSLMMLKNEFHNSKLESIEKDPDECISTLEGLRIWMNKFSLKDKIMDKDFTILVLNNLPKEYDVILDRLENYLTESGNNILTLDICKKIKPPVWKN